MSFAIVSHNSRARVFFGCPTGQNHSTRVIEASPPQCYKHIYPGICALRKLGHSGGNPVKENGEGGSVFLPRRGCDVVCVCVTPQPNCFLSYQTEKIVP